MSTKPLSILKVGDHVWVYERGSFQHAVVRNVTRSFIDVTVFNEDFRRTVVEAGDSATLMIPLIPLTKVRLKHVWHTLPNGHQPGEIYYNDLGKDDMACRFSLSTLPQAETTKEEKS